MLHVIKCVSGVIADSYEATKSIDEIMGISCDFEAESMESEIKPTCNKEFIKHNGHNELDGTTAKMATAITINDSTEPEVTIIDDLKSTDDVVLISPIQTPEVCVQLSFLNWQLKKKNKINLK